MKYATCLIAFLATALLPLEVRAQTPTELTHELIAKLQKSQSLDPVIEEVDWSGAYDSMDPEQRKEMGLKSAEELKASQIENYRGMGTKVKGSVERALKNVPPEKVAVLEAMQERLNASLAEQEEKAKSDFSETSYAVGDAKVGETDAQVEIVKTKGETVTKSTVEYIKVNGKWKLKSAAPLSPSATGAKGEPGNLLGPSISSPDAVVLRK